MAPPITGATLVRKLLESAGWSVELVPSGWKAFEPSPGRRAVLWFRDGDIPAGFQRHFPADHDYLYVLLESSPSPHDLDRLELAGAKALGWEEAAGTLVGLLRPAPGPPDPLEPTLSGSGDGASPSPATAAPLPPQPPPRAPRPPTPEPAGSGERLPSAWSEEEPFSREARSEGVLRQDPVPFAPEVFESDRIIKPRLQEEDLRHMAVGRWRGGSPRLVLVPFYLFAYALPEDEEATSAPPRLVAVPAVGGAPQFWGPGEREIISALGHPHQRPTRRIDVGRARDEAIEAIRARHSRLEEKAEQRRGMLVIENRRRPRELEEVRLGPPAFVWVPHWVVEAWNGREVLDAVTGLPSDLPLEHDEAER